MMYWNVATEDELSESVAERLLRSLSPPVELVNRFRRRGFGYLRKNAGKWRSLARTQAVLLLTDLDRAACPPGLISEWFGEHTRMPDRLLVRVAVREAESWLLADHEAMRSLLDSHSGLPDAPDTLPDPKQTLLTLARQAPREVRLGLVRQEGTRLRQALRYNSLLSEWVFTEWEPERAAKRSESLRRAIHRIKERALEFSGK